MSSMGPLGHLGSIAGTPFAQTQGASTERQKQDANVQQRQVDTAQHAESAAGIGETDADDNSSHERDADGRRIWEETARSGDETPPEAEDHTTPPGSPQDPDRGQQLDLTG